MSDLNENEPISEINIVPFVDIILVILIIFMITAPQLAREGFSVQLPQAQSSKPIEDSRFEIQVRNTGDIILDGKLISLEELSFYSRKKIENSSSKRALISADAHVSHGRVMEIVQTMKFSGFQSFTFSGS